MRKRIKPDTSALAPDCPHEHAHPIGQRNADQKPIYHCPDCGKVSADMEGHK